jgi:hypothetical protein
MARRRPRDSMTRASHMTRNPLCMGIVVGRLEPQLQKRLRRRHFLHNRGGTSARGATRSFAASCLGVPEGSKPNDCM